MVHLPVMAVIIQYKSIDFKDIAIVYVKKEFILKILVKIKQKKIMNKFDLIGKTGDIYYNN